MIVEEKTISGSGGGGKSGSSSGGAQISSPTLFSEAFFKAQFLLSHGEIEGLIDGGKTVYINGTPVENEDGSTNFEGVQWHLSTGTQAQPSVPGFFGASAEKEVAVQVKKGTPITRRITDSSIDMVRVTIKLPDLSSTDLENGNYEGASVSYEIALQTDDQGFVIKVRQSWANEVTKNYLQQHQIELPGDGPWDIRVTRITDDNDGPNVRDETWWHSYTEVVYEKFTYANRAILSIKVPAKIVPNLYRATIGVGARGTRIKVFSNYDPETRTYLGDWDGGWKTLYSNNPVLCLIDMLTNPVYGMGQYFSIDNIDKRDFYHAARRCDGMVDDGYNKGNKEPRYTCNLYLQKQAEAIKVIRDMASICDAGIYWTGALLRIAQDRPADIKTIFTESMIVGFFNYLGTSRHARHTVVNVAYNDPTNGSKQRHERVEDREGIALYGPNEKNISAFGLSSRGQAYRKGKHTIISDLTQDEIVEFETLLDSIFLRAGDIIGIQDSLKSGKDDFSGRTKGTDGTTINLDRAVTLEKGKDYTLICMLPDGTHEKRRVITNDREHESLTVESEFSAELLDYAPWALYTDDMVLQQFRVTEISDKGKGRKIIRGLKHNPGKYEAIESGIKLEPLPTTSFPKALDKPIDLDIEERLVNIDGVARIVTKITWDAGIDAVKFSVRYRRFGDYFKTLPDTPHRFVEIVDVFPGTYEFEVTAISAMGIYSSPATKVGEILGSNAIAVMPDVTGLMLKDKAADVDEFEGNNPTFEWDPVRVKGIAENAIHDHFQIHVYDISGSEKVLLYTRETKDNEFTFDIEKNAEGTGLESPPALPAQTPFSVFVPSASVGVGAGTVKTTHFKTIFALGASVKFGASEIEVAALISVSGASVKVNAGTAKTTLSTSLPGASIEIAAGKVKGTLLTLLSGASVKIGAGGVEITTLSLIPLPGASVKIGAGGVEIIRAESLPGASIKIIAGSVETTLLNSLPGASIKIIAGLVKTILFKTVQAPGASMKVIAGTAKTTLLVSLPGASIKVGAGEIKIIPDTNPWPPISGWTNEGDVSLDKKIKSEGAASLRFDGLNYIKTDDGSEFIIGDDNPAIGIKVRFKSLPKVGEIAWIIESEDLETSLYLENERGGLYLNFGFGYVQWVPSLDTWYSLELFYSEELVCRNYKWNPESGDYSGECAYWYTEYSVYLYIDDVFAGIENMYPLSPRGSIGLGRGLDGWLDELYGIDDKNKTTKLNFNS